ncbi:MAG: hypothetical protein ACRC3B_02530 [Bacteroidia bacterium]
MDNLDHTFDSRLREEFGQLDVRFNEAHWARLDAALSATQPLTFFQKHRRVILLFFLLLILSAVLLMVYRPGAMNAKRISPATHKLNLPAQNSNGGQTVPEDLSNIDASGTQGSSERNTSEPSAGGQPASAALPAAAIDSMRTADSIAAKHKADSLQLLKKKKKLHLIW